MLKVVGWRVGDKYENYAYGLLEKCLLEDNCLCNYCVNTRRNSENMI